MNKLLIIKRFKQQSNSWLVKISSSFEQAANSKALSEKGKNPDPSQSSIRNEWVGWMENLSLIRSKAALLPTLLFFCWVSACKEKDELPAPTQTGANTFGCYVDGRKWVPNGKNEAFNKIPAISCGFYDDYNVVGKRNNLFMILTMSNGETIQLYIKDCYKPGRYELNKATGSKLSTINPEASYGRFSRNENEIFMTNPEYSGFINLTVLDTSDVYAAGTFEFEGYSTSLKKTVKITSGRFDVNMAKL